MLAPFLLTKITTITKIIVVMSKKVHNLDGSCRGQKGKKTPAGVYNKGKKCKQEVQQCGGGNGRANREEASAAGRGEGGGSGKLGGGQQGNTRLTGPPSHLQGEGVQGQLGEGRGW